MQQNYEYFAKLGSFFIGSKNNQKYSKTNWSRFSWSNLTMVTFFWRYLSHLLVDFDMKGHPKNALLTSFLKWFWQSIANWKGITDITFGKALHVIPYKNENIARKIVLISRNIIIMIWLYTSFESVMAM